MFERFTDRARVVVVRAGEEARAAHHPEIGDGHVLLGVLDEQYGIGAQCLGDAGVDAETTRAALVEVLGPGVMSEDDEGHVGWNAEGKHVLEQSLREALLLDQNYIGTEHLLLGVLNVDDTGTEILRHLGVDTVALRADIHRQMGVTPPDPDDTFEG